jgi:hypothetical protein
LLVVEEAERTILPALGATKCHNGRFLRVGLFDLLLASSFFCLLLCFASAGWPLVGTACSSGSNAIRCRCWFQIHFARTAFSEPFQFLPFVVRRDRLDEVGGFPDQTISEDINLTCTMLTHGYRTSWLNEPLSFGPSAEDIPEYVTQRARWCLGTIQVALLRNGPLLGRGFSFTQRWHYLHGVRREHFPHGTTRLVAR